MLKEMFLNKWLLAVELLLICTTGVFATLIAVLLNAAWYGVLIEKLRSAAVRKNKREMMKGLAVRMILILSVLAVIITRSQELFMNVAADLITIYITVLMWLICKKGGKNWNISE